MRTGLQLLLVWLVVGATDHAVADEPIDFNRDIRPILSENCFFCHGQDPNKRQADLRLDQREVAIDAGVIVPGDATNSALIDRTISEDPDMLMPPPTSRGRLSPEQNRLVRRWINEGAAYDTHWAYVTPTRPAEPNVRNQAWPRNAIDRFVLARLESDGLSPSPTAERAILIRRLSIDLTGLPPTPQEVDAFIADSDPQAYERLVDRLLASGHYGERMALPWLDAARYADSNGFQQDGDTWQWIWRDWVVRALNDDLPFDQFTIWQLAGDLLPDATTDQQIASGFNRNHLLNGEGGAIAEEQRFVNLFDRINTTATTWLGLTVACAQCHDHKYDPITQQDYYSLLDAFNRVPESGTPQRQSARIRVAAPFIELPTEENKARIAEFESRIAEAETSPATAERLESLKQQLADYRGDQVPRVMIMSDAKPRETRILMRGEYLQPADPVSFATPAFLPRLPEGTPPNRLGLAQWLVSPDHPLTARVQVNRMWQYFFGMGIVKTSEDLGVQSEFPIHKELLDWLAVKFRESGWSMKGMHRLIVTSATYRQTSRVTEQHRQRDIANRRYARASRFRMPAMILRDWALASATSLERRLGGPPVYPYQPKNVWEPLAITKERDFTYPASTGKDLYRRSLYTFWRRTVGPANMFDASNRQACRVRHAVTSTPLHALTTLNDPTWVEAARLLARQSGRAGDAIDEQLTHAFRRVLCRKPGNEDLKRLRVAYQKQLNIYERDRDAALELLSVGAVPRDETLDPSSHAALTTVCLGILNLDEALCRE